MTLTLQQCIPINVYCSVGNSGARKNVHNDCYLCDATETTRGMPYMPLSLRL
jgi:hypothetical protein